ncbi:hypothetical protein BC833DRAFT_611258, partial [Globomyces pollinis-pini]
MQNTRQTQQSDDELIFEKYMLDHSEVTNTVKPPVWMLYGVITLIAGCSIALVPFFKSDKSIPWVPTTNEKSKVIFEHINKLYMKNAIQKKELRFVDLGSGDGRMVLQAARLEGYPFKFIESVGLEYNPTLYFFSTIRSRIFNRQLKNTQFVRADFWKYNIQRFDVAMIFGIPVDMVKFGQKFEQEMKKDSLVLTNKFPIPGWTPLITYNEISIYQLGKHRDEYLSKSF